MEHEIREGYYKDKYGRWQPDRRSGVDRRQLAAKGQSPVDHDRRKMYRRKADRELFERDHQTMIKEALEDFAEEHGGHL